MQCEFLLFSDCLLWLVPLESHSLDWDWSWSGSGSGISRNSVGITTRSKSEAEILSLKDDDLSLAAESSPVSLQKLDRRKSQQFGVSLSRNGKGRKNEKRNAVIQQRGDIKWIIRCHLFGYRMGRQVRV